MTPEETSGSPDSMMSSPISHWIPFGLTSDGECLGCGYQYGSVEELAEHQRLDHGLAEVIF